MIQQGLSLTGNILLSNIVPLSHPFKLTYAVTYRCNSRCTICNIWKRKKFDELSSDEIQTFFTKNDYFNWIDITGGEVFLKPGLIEMIDTIIKTQKNLYLLHIPTNGILTAKILQDVKSILALGPNKFIMTFSVDGPPDLHDKLRGIKNNWKQTVASYKSAKSLASKRFDCYFGMTLSAYNFKKIEETYESIKKEIPELSRNDLHFNIAHQSSHYYGNEKITLNTTSDIAGELIQFNRKKQTRWDGVSLLERRFQELIPRYLETRKTPIPCKALNSSLFMDPNGTLYPCSMWNFPLGNIRDISSDLRKLWKSPLATKTHHVINSKKCPNCWTPCEAYQSILGHLLRL